MPYRFVDLATGETREAESNPAEIGTLLLEFGTLAKLTGRTEFFDRAKRALVEVYLRRAATGLVGEKIDVETGEAEMATGERTATIYGALHAFLPGLLALDGDLERARRLQLSGFRMWRLRGIEPEELDYATLQIVSAGYPLRPEIIESAYVLHELTGDPAYQEMGRVFFRDLRRYCRTAAGYTVLESVVSHRRGDRMHSFFLAETLKYLYLLYAPDALDFEHVVFNTEAHPLRRTW